MLCKTKPENELKHRLLIVYLLNSQHVPCLNFGSCQPDFPIEQSGMAQGMAVSFPKGSMDKTARDLVLSLQTSRVKFSP